MKGVKGFEFWVKLKIVVYKFKVSEKRVEDFFFEIEEKL